MFGRARPRAREFVTSSDMVVHDRVPVARISRDTEGNWMYLAGSETPMSTPIRVHFGHLAANSPALFTLKLRRGEYALRSMRSDSWHRFGPVSDQDYDRLLETGVIDNQQAEIDEQE